MSEQSHYVVVETQSEDGDDTRDYVYHTRTSEACHNWLNKCISRKRLKGTISLAETMDDEWLAEQLKQPSLLREQNEAWILPREIINALHTVKPFGNAKKKAKAYKYSIRPRTSNDERKRLMGDIPAGHKQCRMCERIKRLSEFHNQASSPDGKRYQCKKCFCKYQSKYRVSATTRPHGVVAKNNNINNVGRVCVICGVWKYWDSFTTNKRGVNGKRAQCNVCVSAYRRKAKQGKCDDNR